jgi:hypothetical protein
MEYSINGLKSIASDLLAGAVEGFEVSSSEEEYFWRNCQVSPSCPTGNN